MGGSIFDSKKYDWHSIKKKWSSRAMDIRRRILICLRAERLLGRWHNIKFKQALTVTFPSEKVLQNSLEVTPDEALIFFQNNPIICLSTSSLNDDLPIFLNKTMYWSNRCEIEIYPVTER
jgi:hypothetical protein